MPHKPKTTSLIDDNEELPEDSSGSDDEIVVEPEEDLLADDILIEIEDIDEEVVIVEEDVVDLDIKEEDNIGVVVDVIEKSVVVRRPIGVTNAGNDEEEPPPFALGERVKLVDNIRPRTGVPIGDYPIGAEGVVEAVLSLTAIVRFDMNPDDKDVVAFTCLESIAPAPVWKSYVEKDDTGIELRGGGDKTDLPDKDLPVFTREKNGGAEVVTDEQKISSKPRSYVRSVHTGKKVISDKEKTTQPMRKSKDDRVSAKEIRTTRPDKGSKVEKITDSARLRRSPKAATPVPEKQTKISHLQSVVKEATMRVRKAVAATVGGGKVAEAKPGGSTTRSSTKKDLKDTQSVPGKKAGALHKNVPAISRKTSKDKISKEKTAVVAEVKNAAKSHRTVANSDNRLSGNGTSEIISGETKTRKTSVAEKNIRSESKATAVKKSVSAVQKVNEGVRKNGGEKIKNKPNLQSKRSGRK